MYEDESVYIIVFASYLLNRDNRLAFIFFFFTSLYVKLVDLSLFEDKI